MEWHCKCSCGKESSVRRGDLTRGTTQSCGCLRKEKLALRRCSLVKDLTGQVFGRLTVKEMAPRETWRSCKVEWICDCFCGGSLQAIGHSLKVGHTKSCGCLHKDVLTKHGHAPLGARTSTYNIWASMRNRCFNPKYRLFKDYGGRGITVCDRWANSFENFLADMGERPEGMTLERKDNDGNYEPSNCRWASRWEQACNRRNTVFLEYQGQRKPLAVWAKEFGISTKVLTARILKGWEVERALTTPKHPRYC